MSSESIVPLLHEILSRLSLLESKIGSGGNDGSAGSSSLTADIPRSVVAFDDYMSTFVEPFVSASGKLGGDAHSSALLVKEGFDELRDVLLKAAACKEPSKEQLPTLLAGISAKIKAANSAVKRNEWGKHTKTLSEGIGMLNWY